jgi:hypothetical protein
VPIVLKLGASTSGPVKACNVIALPVHAYMDQVFVTKRQNRYRLGPCFAEDVKLSVL